MSEQYGVWRVDSYEKDGGIWCFDGSPDKRFVRDPIVVARSYAAEMREMCPNEIYEVRPYPSPEAKPAESDWQKFSSSLKPGDVFTESRGEYRLLDVGKRIPGPTLQPSDIRRVQPIDADSLAMSLFASDPAVEAFVTARAENADRYEATLRIAFDRDENGWATHARNRAARVIARMAK